MPAFFLLTYPAATLLLHGGASALSIAAAVISLALLFGPRMWTGFAPLRWDSADTRICIAMACPLAATLVSELRHLSVISNTLDSPSRFLAAAPLFLVLRRTSPRTLAWADLSFALGAVVSLAVLLVAPKVSGIDRLSSRFLNPIHYGDIALVLGALSILSLNWWRKDNLPVRVIKIAGLVAGLAASVLTGSRGGWIAVPVVAVLILYVRGRGKSRRWKLVLPIAMLAIVVGVFTFSHTARDRVTDISSDLLHYEQGQRDTSLGIRLQLYEAAVKIIEAHPVFGLGAHGFRDSMPSFSASGVLTPVAAQTGEGETHNQMLAYLTDYGLIGGLALLAIYVVPGVIFWKRLNTPTAPAGRAALMGLTFVVGFWIFGLTVETFDLKLTVAFYATMVAILAALATYADKTGNGT
ncbi:O-antigen ligase family protein [Paraburkholderia sp. D15]|uniref:O-antigen ligase family protein n=1 Tax=Paraburkholderia sp. D15 TaxID=2880218 RepID=UPI00247956AE|nr:O-antigen ligase [Paraburkholderia sp. D15]WGS50630.1 O-antigen ligase family protein [Paraburkholderia sp. D15]